MTVYDKGRYIPSLNEWVKILMAKRDEIPQEALRDIVNRERWKNVLILGLKEPSLNIKLNKDVKEEIDSYPYTSTAEPDKRGYYEHHKDINISFEKKLELWFAPQIVGETLYRDIEADNITLASHIIGNIEEKKCTRKVWDDNYSFFGSLRKNERPINYDGINTQILYKKHSFFTNYAILDTPVIPFTKENLPFEILDDVLRELQRPNRELFESEQE